jgi:quercetin dioxygenase-like cupin family protein
MTTEISPMRIALLLSFIALIASTAQGQNSAPMAFYPVADIQWKDGPPSLPKGVKMAVLEGDPTKEGMFTMRIKFPAGLHVKPHFHSETEHATVISGTLHIGMGDKFDKANTKPLVAGSFGYWPAGMRHYAWFEGETVLQVHGLGPWTITYANPADDPRNDRKTGGQEDRKTGR